MLIYYIFFLSAIHKCFICKNQHTSPGELVAQNRNPGLILSNYILAFHFPLICIIASSKPIRLFDRLLLVFPGSVPAQATG